MKRLYKPNVLPNFFEKHTLFLLALLISTLFLTISIFIRPLFPIDETRYISVAWEMHTNSSYLVPLLNQEPYFHKPPLLFWLINLGWFLFGNSEATARLMVALFSIGNLFVIYYLAKFLYPNTPQARQWSPLILSSFFLWTVFSGTLMFDCLLTFFILLYVGFMLLFIKKQKFIFVLIAGLMGGLSMLAKGPVALIYMAPIFLFYPLWKDKTQQALPLSRVYWGLFFSLLMAILIILSWAIPAALHGGAAYAKQLLWHQTVDRMSGSMAHDRPWFWYLPLLPLALLPLALSIKVWKLFFKKPTESADLFCILWAFIPFILLSIIGGKQFHYLIPLLPPFAIFLASKQSSWAETPHLAQRLIIFCIFSVLVCLFWPLLFPPTHFSYNQLAALIPLLTGFLIFYYRKSYEMLNKMLFLIIPICGLALLISSKDFLYATFSMEPLAQKISDLQKQHQTVAIWEKYDDQYHFFGRLEGRLKVTKSLSWLDNHADAIVLFSGNKNNPQLLALATTSYTMGSKEIYYIPAEKLAKFLRT